MRFIINLMSKYGLGKKDNFFHIATSRMSGKLFLGALLFMFMVSVMYLWYLNGKTLWRDGQYIYPQMVSREVPELLVTSADITDIHFEFRRNGIVGPYDGLFGTAPGNIGIRVEFAPAAWAILVGADNDSGYVGFELGPLPELHKWNDMDIHVGEGSIVVKLNGVIVAEHQVSGLNYIVNTITLGEGYLPDRRFNGEIRDFNIFMINNNIFAKYIIKILIAVSCILWLYVILSIFNKSGFFLHLKNDFSSSILTHGICLGIFYTIQKNRYISSLLFQFVFCILSIFVVSRTNTLYAGLYFTQIIYIILFTITFNVILSCTSGIFHYFTIFYALITVYLFSFTVRLSIETSVSSFFFVLSVLAIITSLGRRISWRVIRGGGISF